jgi:quercetin dioxygenase-like cupin family protein
MTNHLFDAPSICWQTLDGFAHLSYCILNIDEEHHIINVLFKFSAQQQIVLHRHKALNHTFVIQGEHRLYKADGTLKECRTAGSYTCSPANDEPHREGGGDSDTVVFFSIRSLAGVLYEILDDDLNTVATLSTEDFANLYQLQISQQGAKL